LEDKSLINVVLLLKSILSSQKPAHFEVTSRKYSGHILSASGTLLHLTSSIMGYISQRFFLRSREHLGGKETRFFRLG
jgi:hypothetical protein